MNTIITRHYPASRLPEDLREGINPSSLVTVTIVQRTASPPEAGANPDEIAESNQPAIGTKGQVDVDLRRRRDERDE